jgi:hypothetical protein
MCNVRYEYTNNNTNSNNNSLLEQAFEHVYLDYMGMVYKCKICETIVKSALDAFMHMKNYHGITTLDKLQAYFELKKTINEINKEANQEAKQVQEQKQDDDKKQEQKQNENKIVIKKVLKPKQKTLLHYLNTSG